MRAWRWLISGFIILYATALYANEGEPDPGNTIDRLDDIVVTATKTEKRVADAPAAVTVVTREDMDRRNFKTVDAALNSLEGVFVKRSKGLMDATAGVRMRGFNNDHATLVLLDEPTSSLDLRHQLGVLGLIAVTKVPGICPSALGASMASAPPPARWMAGKRPWRRSRLNGKAAMTVSDLVFPW